MKYLFWVAVLAVMKDYGWSVFEWVPGFVWVIVLLVVALNVAGGLGSLGGSNPNERQGGAPSENDYRAMLEAQRRMRGE